MKTVVFFRAFLHSCVDPINFEYFKKYCIFIQSNEWWFQLLSHGWLNFGINSFVESKRHCISYNYTETLVRVNFVSSYIIFCIKISSQIQRQLRFGSEQKRLTMTYILKSLHFLNFTRVRQRAFSYFFDSFLVVLLINILPSFFLKLQTGLTIF